MLGGNYTFKLLATRKDDVDNIYDPILTMTALLLFGERGKSSGIDVDERLM